MEVPFSIRLVGLGIAMGTLHVLTGPDHLSALATLSANMGNCKAFTLGVRWGIGHSTGLIIVATIMIAASQGKDEEKIEMSSLISTILESFVGVFMILLGTYGLYSAFRKDMSEDFGLSIEELENQLHLRNEQMPISNLSTIEEVDSFEDDDESGDFSDQSPHGGESSMSIADVPDSKAKSNSSFTKRNERKKRRRRRRHAKTPVHQKITSCMKRLFFCHPCCFRFRHMQSSQKLLACCIGTIHGVAGPGGVLGVLPAVQLHDWKYASIYLITFCATSTLIMGAFAGSYGICTSRLSSKTHMEFIMECISSFLSILVGIIWIVLLSIGKLDQVFG